MKIKREIFAPQLVLKNLHGQMNIEDIKIKFCNSLFILWRFFYLLVFQFFKLTLEKNQTKVKIHPINTTFHSVFYANHSSSFVQLFSSLLFHMPLKEIFSLSHCSTLRRSSIKRRKKWNFFHFTEHHRRKREWDWCRVCEWDEGTKTILSHCRLWWCMAMHMLAITTYVKADERILFSEKHNMKCNKIFMAVPYVGA